MAIPSIAMKSLIQPVSAMLRNSLIAAGPLLKDLDWSHLQMLLPSTGTSDPSLKGTVLVKPSSDTHYKLETKQQFTFTRIDANEALNTLELTDRTFSKKDYPALAKFLENMGSFKVISGDLESTDGNASVIFTFGDDTEDRVAGRYIDLGSAKFVKAHYGYVFYGVVQFTFLGENSTETEEPVTTPDENTDNAVNIAPYFTVTDIGDLTTTLLR